MYESRGNRKGSLCSRMCRRKQPLRGATISLIVAFVALLGATSGLAAPPPEGPAPRSYRIRAAGSAWMPLRIPVRSSISNIRIRGGGRVTGVLIVAADPEPPTAGDFGYAFRTTHCIREPCGTRDTKYATSTRTLAEGDYVLYVVSEAGPVRIRIDVRGATEERLLHPSGHLETDVRALRTAEAIPSGQFGYTTRLRGKGFTFYSLWLKAQQHIMTAYAHCVYRDRSTLPVPGIAFTPLACPPYGRGDVAIGPTMQGSSIWSFGTAPLLARSVGGWYFSVAHATTASADVVWIKAK